MKLMSFIKEGKKLVPVELELALWPGLPSIQFLGLPDQHLKESALRIKSALKAQGFVFPKAQQILVNLRPSHLKKTSRGLELAVAAAYLWETQQLPLPVTSHDFFVYGELSLSGEVFEPEDLPEFLDKNHCTVLTGAERSNTVSANVIAKKQYHCQKTQDLRGLANPLEIKASDDKQCFHEFMRPPLPSSLYFTKSQADLLSVLAVGEHSCLLAGPSGSGKTTLAKTLYYLLPEPKPKDWQDCVAFHQELGQFLTYPPLIKPHHTTPVQSMLGGGFIPMAGEVTRAHGGLLILDEFLEFKSQIQEALREPLEEGVIRIARGAKHEVFLARSQCLATTNLCPCGDAVPSTVVKKKTKICRFSKKRCRSYRERLSGPLLDRFQILYYSDLNEVKSVSLAEILERVEMAREFQKSRGRASANHENIEDIKSDLQPFWQERLEALACSQRRKNALLRLARSWSDLWGDLQMGAKAYDRAYAWTVANFEHMRKWDL